MLLCTIITTLLVRSVVAELSQVELRLETAPRCRYIPGDAGWPQPQLWSQLNQTVSRRLIATVPVASVCHDPNYDEAKCNKLAAKFGLVEITYAIPGRNVFVTREAH